MNEHKKVKTLRVGASHACLKNLLALPCLESYENAKKREESAKRAKESEMEPSEPVVAVEPSEKAPKAG